VSLKTFLAVVMIFRISCGESSSRLLKRQPATALVGIRRDEGALAFYVLVSIRPTIEKAPLEQAVDSSARDKERKK